MRTLSLVAALAVLVACGPSKPPGPAAVEVEVAAAAQQDVPITTEAIGTTEGAVDAEIRAQVAGILISRDYKEGTEVKKGALLFHIDPRQYQATLDQARGDLGRASAALEKSRLDVARYEPLAKQGAVSQQELDNAVQAKRGNEALMQTARAAVEKAALDLDYTQIRAPIDGIAGAAAAQVGNLVGPTDPHPLTTVSQLDPIRVSFPLSEREYLRFARNASASQRIQSGEARLELILADGSTWVHKGVVVPAAAGVDPRTGTIMVRGEFPNPEKILRVGQYARVRAITDVRTGAITVPQRAVSELQGVFQVAVVGSDDKVVMRVVEPGPRFGTDQVIEKGLAAGERVVVEGIQKVRDGVVVAPKPAAVAAGG